VTIADAQMCSSFSNAWSQTWTPLLDIAQWSGETSTTLQPDVSWSDWCHECVYDIHSLLQYAPHVIVYRIQITAVGQS